MQFKKQSISFTQSMMNEMMSRYPHSNLSTDTVKAYLSDWTEIVRNTSESRFAEALKECLRTCKFFPLPANILENMPEQGAADKKRMAYDENCTDCGGSGWRSVGADRPSRDNPRPKENRVARCHCARITTGDVDPQMLKDNGGEFFTVGDVFREYYKISGRHPEMKAMIDREDKKREEHKRNLNIDPWSDEVAAKKIEATRIAKERYGQS